MAPAMSVTQLFDSVAIRIAGPRAWSEHISIDWIVTDDGDGTRYRMELSNGALVHFPTKADATADATFTLTKRQVLGVVALGTFDGVEVVGDHAVWQKIVGFTEEPDPNFNIVTP
jgi:alkyl sulfatase BDS1-like metallo-beta-lactamase superfamily hydrolase